MAISNTLDLVTSLPKLIGRQALQPLRLALRQPLAHPSTQRDMAKMVDDAISSKIRAGFTHRFITLMFVTVGDRVFCRRYSYGEPSWYSAFQSDSKGQIKLDKTIVNIEARIPHDLDDVISAVDDAYAAKLKQYGASFMLDGAVETRAQESTIELLLADSSATET
ncbi:MAG: DUF2255 family protein [Chromatiales bacterium]|nr:DUF2255 family protein [Chromatiales bacterium]